MNKILLEVSGLTKSFGALLASDDVSLEIREGETHAIIGPNGAGKTTLISQLAGNLRPDRGRVRFAGEDITTLSAPARARRGFARSFQITSIYPEFTALENVMLAVQARSPATVSDSGGQRARRRACDRPQARFSRKWAWASAPRCWPRTWRTASSVSSRSRPRSRLARAYYCSTSRSREWARRKRSA
jgi:ABC-type branched-subunit amino acid transport system ATPase component